MNPPMNRTSSATEHFPNQMDLLQSTLIDPSQTLMQKDHYRGQQYTDEAIDNTDGNEISNLNSQNEMNLLDTRDISINNSSEKYIFLNENQFDTLENQPYVEKIEKVLADDSLGDLFIR